MSLKIFLKNSSWIIISYLYILALQNLTLEFQIEGEGRINGEAGKFQPK